MPKLTDLDTRGGRSVELKKAVIQVMNNLIITHDFIYTWREKLTVVCSMLNTPDTFATKVHFITLTDFCLDMEVLYKNPPWSKAK